MNKSINMEEAIVGNIIKIEQGVIKMSKELDEAIKLHKALDKKEGYTSPNNLWPPDLIDYYNEKEIKENEDKS